MSRFEVSKGSFIRLVFAFELRDPSGYETSVRHVGSGSTKVSWSNRRIRRNLVLPHLWRHLNAEDFADGTPESLERELGGEVAHWWETNLDPRKGRPALPNAWTLRIGKTDVDFTLNKLELVLFRTGSGFLVFEVTPLGDSVDDWFDLNHHIRYFDLEDLENDVDLKMHSLDRSDRACLVVPKNQAGRKPFLGALDGQETSFDRPRGLGFLSDWILDDAFGDTGHRVVHGPGRMLSFSFVSVRSGKDVSDRDRFEARFRWRRMLSSKATVHSSDDNDLNGRVVPYADGVFFSFSLDGGGVFAVDTPDAEFFASTMSDDVRRPYFFGFLIAYQQRLTLLGFSSLISGLLLGRPDGLRSVREVFDRYLEYLSSCSFVHIMQTANHARSHRTWADVFGISLLQNEVESQLRRLHERAAIEEAREAERFREEVRIREEAEAARASRTDRRFSVFALAFAIPSLVLSALGIIDTNGVSPVLTWSLLIGLVAAGFGLSELVRRWRTEGDTGK